MGEEFLEKYGLTREELKQMRKACSEGRFRLVVAPSSK
jgi:hypothetical protein